MQGSECLVSPEQICMHEGGILRSPVACLLVAWVSCLDLKLNRCLTQYLTYVDANAGLPVGHVHK